MVECIAYQTAAQFLEACESFMLQAETENNLILGLADSMAHNKREFTAPLYFGLFENGSVVGAALRTDAHRPLSIQECQIMRLRHLT
ncbi:MAG: hypothetical protein GY813_11140 [Halieaceae bacterium]|nr:hypothetical protein [Halieaceae bacterium]